MRRTTLVLLLMTLISTPALGGDCIDYASTLQVVYSTDDMTGAYRCFASLDHYLYVGSTTPNLLIYDIENPGEPTFLADIDISPHEISSIAIVGKTAYLTAPNTGSLLAYDLTDPLIPLFLGDLPLDGEPSQVVVQDAIACVTSVMPSYGILSIVDVGDAAAMQVLSTQSTPGEAVTVARSGNHVYVGSAYPAYRLYTYNITTPTAPVETMMELLTRTVSRLEVDAGRLYMAGGGPDLRIYDLADPATPILVGELEEEGVGSHDVTLLDGGRVFMSNGGSTGSLIDVGDPHNPALIDIVQLPQEECREAIGLGNFVFASMWLGGMAVIDCTNASEPSLANSVELPNWGGEDSHIEVVGDLAYVSGMYSDLYVVDLTDPDDLQLTGSLHGFGPILSMAVAEPHVFVSGYYGGLDVYLATVDVSDPENPEIANVYYDLLEEGEIHLAGEFLLQTGIAGFHKYDVSDPLDPIYAGPFQVEPGYYLPASDILVHGSTLFVSFPGLGLYAVDFIVPTNPQVIDHLPWVAGVERLFLFNGLLYCVGEDPDAVTVVGIEDPTDMQVQGAATYDFGEFHEITVTNSHAYITNSSGLEVYSFGAEPWNMQLVGRADWGKMHAIVQGGDYLQVISKSGINGYFQNIYYDCGDLVGVIDQTPTPDTLALTSYPNPFNPHTTITFALPVSECLRLSIHDVSGREVALLADREFGSGNHAVIWRGENAHGRALPSGVYLVRLWNGSVTAQRKLVLIR